MCTPDATLKTLIRRAVRFHPGIAVAISRSCDALSRALERGFDDVGRITLATLSSWGCCHP
jgi:hypothetical protein